MSNFRLNRFFFQWLFQKVLHILKSDIALKDFFQDYYDKITKINLKKEVLLPLLERLQIIMKMIKAYKNQNYRAFSYQFIVSAIGTVLYFILPFDFIMDFIPGGYLDDIALITYFFHCFENEITKFKDWESKQ